MTGLLPTAMLIGPGRSGTTALFNHLSRQKGVSCSRIKEIGVFRPLLAGDASIDLTAYRDAFDDEGSEAVRIEGTPAYFQGGSTIAESIRARLGVMPVVITLRDPVDRFLSVFEHVKNKVVFDPEFQFSDFVERCVEVKQRGVQSDMDFHFLALVESNYGLLIEEWSAVLGRERVLVTFFEDLEAQPEQVMGSIRRHLLLPESDERDAMIARTNAATAVRLSRFHKIAVQLNNAAEPWLRANPRLKDALRTAYYWLNAERAKTSRDHYRHEARAVLTEECSSLAQLPDFLQCAKVESELPSWVYDWGDRLG